MCSWTQLKDGPLAGARLAAHPDIPLDIIADDLRRAPSRACQVDLGKMDVRTDRVRRARQIHDHLALRTRGGPVNVVEDNVGHVDLGWVGSALGCVHVEVALVEQDRVVGVFDVDVAICDVVDASVANVLSSPCFETSPILPLSV